MVSPGRHNDLLLLLLDLVVFVTLSNLCGYGLLSVRHRINVTLNDDDPFPQISAE